MDIGSGKPYPANKLSNFAPNPFVFDEVPCAGMEGLVQAWKFDKVHIQREVCKLGGLAAKMRGKPRNRAWQKVQTLWWAGQAYDRHGPEYQSLMNRAFATLYEQNESFRRALLAAGTAVFSHGIGNRDPYSTVMTPNELCRRLGALRDLVRRSST